MEAQCRPSSVRLGQPAEHNNPPTSIPTCSFLTQRTARAAAPSRDPTLALLLTWRDNSPLSAMAKKKWKPCLLYTIMQIIKF